MPLQPERMRGTEIPSRREGWFEVIAGTSMPDGADSKCFAFVNRYDGKPKRRLFELLTSQGMQMNQSITFVSDGGDTVRDLQLYLNPQAEHVLDWFHVTMRVTVVRNKGPVDGDVLTRAFDQTSPTAWHRTRPHRWSR